MMDGTRRRLMQSRHRFSARVLTALMIAVGCGVALPGCSSTDYRDVRISTEYDDHTDFAAIGTWGWLAKQPASIQDPRVHDATAYARLRRVIAAELVSRGLKEAKDGSPDVWVHHTVWLMARSDLPRVESGDKPKPARAKSAADDEGGMLIEMLDGKSKKRVWVAQVRAFLKLQVTPEQKEARIRHVVRKMFEEYPPKAWQKAMKTR